MNSKWSWAVLVGMAVSLVGLTACMEGGFKGGADRYTIFMADQRPTILLDTKAGKTWTLSPCPKNPTSYNCWASMSYDAQPQSN